jgi:predicted PurR-regulated permease PerM
MGREALPFFTSFILASILAVVMSPVKEWIIGRFHRPRLATFLTTFATVLVVGIVVASAGFTITRETTACDAVCRRSLEEGG